jgi:hypothetical protein
MYFQAFTGRAKLFLLNTHLESTAEFSEQRKTQLQTCFSHCASFPAEYNVIFGGDLNLRDKEVCVCYGSRMYSHALQEQKSHATKN